MKTLSTRDKLPKRKDHTMKEIQKKVLNTKGYLPKALVLKEPSIYIGSK